MLREVRVAKAGDAPRLGWAEGRTFLLPAAVLEHPAVSPHLRNGRFDSLPTSLHAEGLSAEPLRTQAAFTPAPPLSTRMPFSYQKVPPRVRSFVARAQGALLRRRQNRWAAFPRWPLDLSADFLSDLLGELPVPFASRPTPVIVTHDIDNAESLTHLVRSFLPLEEELCARSTNYVVPCGWPLDHALLDEVRHRGHRLGAHGYDHSNTTPFARPEERRRRLDAAREFVTRHGVLGYRAPSLLRTRPLLQDLAGIYGYDTSIPTSGGPFPVPNNGCATARPFLVEGIPEIPVTLPRDGSLLFLGHSPKDILTLWKQCAELISDAGGIIVVLTHCEPRFSGSREMLAAYRAFLEYVAGSGRYAWKVPEEIAEIKAPARPQAVEQQRRGK